VRKLIHLDRLTLPVQVGIHDFERAAPQRYVVSLWLGLEVAYWCGQDRIEETVDYDRLRAQVVDYLSAGDFALQETLAQHLMTVCFELDARVADARVVVGKPDVYPDCAGVGLDYSATRAEWLAHAR